MLPYELLAVLCPGRAQIALFWSPREVGAGYPCVVLTPLAALVEGGEHRVRVVLEVRQQDSNPALPSCNRVALDKLLNPSGKQFSHLPIGDGNSSCLAGAVRIKQGDESVKHEALCLRQKMVVS